MKDNILNEFKFNGYFSEYLPECFSLNEKMFIPEVGKKIDYVKAWPFTMSRFTSESARRTIHIPEITVYLALYKYIEDNNILDELIEFTQNSEFSYSKILTEDGEIRSHDQDYGGSVQFEKEEDSTYIPNIISKIKYSAGAKKVLKLDIAGCYSNIYTHMIPAILLGYDKADNIFYLSETPDEDDAFKTYKIYAELDKKMRNLNQRRTKGLLIGPMFSAIIVEALLTRIDLELANEEIRFSRYVDDYEVYIYDEDENEIINIFTKVLGKYELNLNSEKTELLEFPYYAVENFDRIINNYLNLEASEYDIVKLFNDFIEMEQAGVKGALSYLLKKVNNNEVTKRNKEIYIAYVLSIMRNNNRSLTKASEILINQGQELKPQYVNIVKKMLKEKIVDRYDLEVIWLVYILIETNNIKEGDSEIEDIAQSENELAQLMLFRKDLLKNNEDIVVEKAKSWILNYELFSKSLITEEELIKRLRLRENKSENMRLYRNFKRYNLHFCY